MQYVEEKIHTLDKFSGYTESQHRHSHVTVTLAKKLNIIFTTETQPFPIRYS